MKTTKIMVNENGVTIKMKLFKLFIIKIKVLIEKILDFIDDERRMRWVDKMIEYAERLGYIYMYTDEDKDTVYSVTFSAYDEDDEETVE